VGIGDRVTDFPWTKKDERWQCPRCPYAIPVQFLPGGVNEALKAHASAHATDDRNGVASARQLVGEADAVPEVEAFVGAGSVGRKGSAG